MAEASNVEQPAVGALERVTQQLESTVSPDALIAAREPAAPEVPSASSAPAPVARPAVVEKSPLRKDIEAALADESLQQIYAGLPPATQGRFQSAGELLAARLEQMLTIGTLNLRTAHSGITSWLQVIPRTNPFFLIQEAKVKTDAIVALSQRPRS